MTKKDQHENLEQAKQEAKKSFAAKVNPGKAAEAKKQQEPNIEKITKLEEELAQSKSKVLVLAAEIENLRKRHSKEIADAHSFSVSNFAKDMIEVLENLYRAEESIDMTKIEEDATLKNIFSGVSLTKKTLIDAFEKNGLKRIFPLGEKFNHDFHQAISQAQAQEGQDSGDVAQVVQAGYMLKDRLLRPALVIVVA